MTKNSSAKFAGANWYASAKVVFKCARELQT
jgi:hypothetical protein